MDQPLVNTSLLFVELGCAMVGLAILARIANWWGFSAIPLYLLAGLAFGKGGLAPLKFSNDFVRQWGRNWRSPAAVYARARIHRRMNSSGGTLRK